MGVVLPELENLLDSELGARVVRVVVVVGLAVVDVVVVVVVVGRNLVTVMVGRSDVVVGGGVVVCTSETEAVLATCGSTDDGVDLLVQLFHQEYLNGTKNRKLSLTAAYFASRKSRPNTLSMVLKPSN